MHAIELDRDLAAQLRQRFQNEPKLTIHEADALRFDYSTLGEDLRVVGNLPYNISTPLLFHLLDYRAHIADMHFMLQKEVVDRMAAAPGSKRYGRLSIMLGCHMQVQPLFDVPPEAFTPPPKVHSGVVALRPLPDSAFQIDNPDAFAALVTKAFSQRRKTVRNALKGLADDEQFQQAGIDPGSRPERIAVENWVALANNLSLSD